MEPTGRLRFVRRETMVSTEHGDIRFVESRVLQQEWRHRWGYGTGPAWWEDVPCEDEE